MPLKHMKKMLFAFMLMFVTISASAQIVVMNNTNTVRLDCDGDGMWDTEVAVNHVPGISYMKTGRNFYSELGRLYCIQIWKQYERMGQNPAAYVPNPESNADFSQYAGYYMRYVGGGMMGAGMVSPMAGGMVGMPGQASIAVGGKNFGVSLSVPVRNANSGYGYTPNASVGVSVNGNYVGASVPVSIVTGKKARTQTRTVAPATRTIQPQPQSQRVAPQTQTQTPTRVVEMTVDEVSQMMNSNDYM